MHSMKIWAASVVVAIAGCGGSSVDIHDYSGTVTFKGQPVVYGKIEFVPDADAGNSGPKGYAEIVDGKYDTGSGSAKGVTGGAYKAVITAYEARPQETTDETVEVEPVKAQFIGYEMKQELPKEDATVDFTVPEDAAGHDPYAAYDPRRRANEP